jgi:cytochrome c oxidase subunit IV
MEQTADISSRSHYRGSHIFSFAAKYAGLQVDQFNFLLAETLALVFAICFRRYLPPKPSNLIKRHLIGRMFYSIYHLIV